MPIENGKLKISGGSFVIEVDRVGNASLPDAFGISELISDTALEAGDLTGGLQEVGVEGDEDIRLVVQFLRNSLSKNPRRQEEFEYRAVKSMVSRLEPLLDDAKDTRLPKDDAPGRYGKDSSGRKHVAGGFGGDDNDW